MTTEQIHVRALKIAEQLASIASDWNLDEVEIDGEMRGIHDVREVFTEAIKGKLYEFPKEDDEG